MYNEISDLCGIATQCKPIDCMASDALLFTDVHNQRVVVSHCRGLHGTASRRTARPPQHPCSSLHCRTINALRRRRYAKRRNRSPRAAALQIVLGHYAPSEHTSHCTSPEHCSCTRRSRRRSQSLTVAHGGAHGSATAIPAWLTHSRCHH